MRSAALGFALFDEADQLGYEFCRGTDLRHRRSALETEAGGRPASAFAEWLAVAGRLFR